jgi:hypothetical protein
LWLTIWENPQTLGRPGQIDLTVDIIITDKTTVYLMSYRAINQCLFPWNKKKGLLAYNNNFYLLRLAAEAITYARPTIRPNAKGIHTPKLSVLTFICCIKLPRNSISLIPFQQVEYKVYISDF